ncbi:unnamed protein product [Rotaria sordida]|uniref:Tetratricopeptide repeat protein n=1 Tax=Rotaria sordida TaxID=392033 RepID=A0A819Y2C8_9BILA|nr:unnamed protein product [Rotaria sordida]
MNYFQQGLQIRLKSLPSDHHDLSSSYVNLGRINSKLNQYHKALEYFQVSLTIMSIIFKEDDQNLELLYFNIGCTYFIIENYQKALRIQLKVMDSTKKDKLTITYKYI